MSDARSLADLAQVGGLVSGGDRVADEPDAFERVGLGLEQVGVLQLFLVLHERFLFVA